MSIILTYNVKPSRTSSLKTTTTNFLASFELLTSLHDLFTYTSNLSKFEHLAPIIAIPLHFLICLDFQEGP